MSMIDFHSLAKTELHCHLDGSLSLPTIRQLAALVNIDLPAWATNLGEPFSQSFFLAFE